MKWMQHVDVISSKISSTWYFLKQLKRSGAGPEDLLFFYVTAICPVLEYACPVWHLSLTVAQTKALESLQQWAMKIIFPDKDYLLSLVVASVDMLESQRQQPIERFFRRSILRESSCLHYLLPDKRDSTITDRLRHAKTFTSFPIRTKKFHKSLQTYSTVRIFMTSAFVRNSRSGLCTICNFMPLLTLDIRH